MVLKKLHLEKLLRKKTMANTEAEKVKAVLRRDSLEDLIGMLADPCEDCEAQHCPRNRATCGYYEDDVTGVKIGPAQARKELLRRKKIIDNALNRGL
jgi:hypothetical protein